MTAFQWIAIPLLLLVFLIEVINLLRRGQRWQRLFRCLVWAAAAAAIAWPELPQTLATAVGIGRAADLVFYLFVLAFLIVSFAFYARYVRLQRQLTEVVRHIAIQEARKGAAARPAEPAP